MSIKTCLPLESLDNQSLVACDLFPVSPEHETTEAQIDSVEL